MANKEGFTLQGDEIHLLKPTLPRKTRLLDKDKNEIREVSIRVTTRRFLICRHASWKLVERQSYIWHMDSPATDRVMLEIPINQFNLIEDFGSITEKTNFGLTSTTSWLLRLDPGRLRGLSQEFFLRFYDMDEYKTCINELKCTPTRGRIHEEEKLLEQEGLSGEQLKIRQRPLIARALRDKWFVEKDNEGEWLPEWWYEIWADNHFQPKDWKQSLHDEISDKYWSLPECETYGKLSIKELLPLLRDITEAENTTEPVSSGKGAQKDSDIDVSQQLEKLANLFEKGLLTEAEFISAKQKLLG